ncbi:MAG: Fic family protein [Candidatus Micrarchaeia archaeon]|jgi:prophage maintenance system killer protein
MDEKRDLLVRLSNGVLIPTEELIISVHAKVIENRRKLGKEDPDAIRDRGLLRHVYDTLFDRMHKYTNNPRENALYVATETFYCIACQHPFVEGNKSTAYLCSLILLIVNQLPDKGEELLLDKWNPGFAPKEAEEITKLAEAGQSEQEVKKLIKEFLQKTII